MNKLDNIVDLDEFRKTRKVEKKSEPHHLKAFQPDQYYIHPELGLMIHVLFVTDKSYHYKNEPVYVMEDQYGNIFSVPINDPENIKGWHLLEKQVFIEIVKKGLPEPEPPRVS